MDKILEKLKVVYSITKYSMLMYFRDKTAIFFSLFVPLLIMSIFGVINFSGSANIKMGLVDEANSQMSKQVIEQLEKVEAFKIEKGTKDDEIDRVRRSETDMVVVLPKELGQNAAAAMVGKPAASAKIEIYADENQSSTANQIGMTILDKIFDQISHGITKTPNLFVLEKQSISTVKLSYVDFLIPGIVAMSIMNMGILGVIGAITSWRERGILKRLLATPITPDSLIFGQVSTRLIISVGQVVVLVGMGLLFFKLTILGSLWNLLILTMLGSVIFLSMGLAASGMAKTQNSVMAIGNLLSMPQMFLSGIFFPLESLPKWLSNITSHLPLAYLADGMREVMTHGASLYQIRTDLLGLAVWGVVCFIIAARFFSWE